MRQTAIPVFPILWIAVMLTGGLAFSIGLRAEPIAPEVGAPDNLVLNSGFEEGGARPAQWGRYPSKDENGNRIVRDIRVAHTGKASGLIESVTPYVPGKPWMQWSQYHRVPIEGGSSLIVSCAVKTEGCQPAHLGFHFYGEKKKHLGFVSMPFPLGEKEWVSVRQAVRVPEQAKSMGFVLYAREKGRTWYDDAYVIGTPSTVATRGTPKLDGILNDACWSEADAIRQFAVHTGAKLSTEKTRAWLAYDDQALYAAFECPRSPGRALKAEATTHDGKTWLDDSIEIFLDPDHDHRGYFQLAINCMGVIRDSRDTDTAWESGARAAVTRGKNAWTVEVAIPFDHLELNLDSGSEWGINLVRNDRIRGETVTWSLGGFHDASRFGNVSLQPNLSLFFRKDLALRLKQVEQRAREVSAEIQAAGLSEKELFVPQNLLKQAGTEMAVLRAIGAGAPLPAGTAWPGVKQRLEGVFDTVSGAREAALQQLFRTGGENGFRVVIAHSLQKISRSRPITRGIIARQVRLSAARDEVESFQLVVIPARERLAGVTVEAPPLEGPGGKLLLEWFRIGFVETAPPKYPTRYVGWWPDPLLPPGSFDVRKGERQPLWFHVKVPPDARPGLYRGTVSVRCGTRFLKVPVQLRVRDFRLPRPGTLATAFGLYAQVLSNGYDSGPYKEKMSQDDFARWCKFMGEYRLTPKNVAREYIEYERKDKEWVFDLNRLENTVATLAPKYYAPYSFCLHRVPTGPGVLKNIQSNRPPNTDDWAAIVKGIDTAWRRLGLPAQVYIYGVDEPRREIYPFLRDAYAKIKKAAPRYPIMQTIGDPQPEALVGSIDIWCPLSPRLDSSFYQERVEAGDILWTYVCVSPKFPYANFFIDRPATEHRVLFWQTWQNRATGFLYWCITYWRGWPVQKPGTENWPEQPLHLKDLGTYKSSRVNGDGVLAYPGPGMTPYPSLRLEVIRDGIEDYEYLALLSRLVKKADAMPAGERPEKALLERARALCQVPNEVSQSMSHYTEDPETIFKRRKQIAEAIEWLQNSTHVVE